MTIDLRMIKTAVDHLIDQAQAESEGTWKTSPYGSSPLTEDIAGLLTEILTNPMATPLENGLSALEIYTRAFQGYAYGDEAKDKAKYDEDREVLRGDTLKEKALCVPETIAQEFNLTAEDAAGLYRILYIILDQERAKDPEKVKKQTGRIKK